tara:strand:+ start:1289 stop:2092 length:804 start_codon:yes stop_codon:yes gene_type:complete
MNKNLILSAAVGYNFQQIEFFIKSLRKYYGGEVCFFIDENENLQKELKKYNCNIIKTNIHKNETINKRNEIFSEYLENKDYDNVLLCDSRDIYFQGNPFEFDYKGPINFFLEDYQIKDCPYNSNWLIKTYGKIAFDSISDKTILCSGTVLGSSSKIREYLSLLKKYSSDFKYKKKFKYLITFRPDPEGRGCEQGHANYLVHKKIIEDYHLYSNSGGPVATAFYLKKIIFDSKSRLISDAGKPYLLVHQYDKRWDEFSQNVNNFKDNL